MKSRHPGPSSAGPARSGKRILLIRRMALGDVVWTTPLVRALREADPEAEIHFRTDYPQVFENNPFLDGVNDPDPLHPPDTKIELVYEYTPKLHLSESYFNSAGLDFVPRDPELFLTEEEKKGAARRLAGLESGQEPLIGLHPGVSWPERTWEWFKWDRLSLDLTTDFKAGVAVLGRSPDFTPTPWPGQINLIDKLNLRELMALISSLDLLVAIDSGLLHLASALGVPTVGIFGCVDPATRSPFSGTFVPVVKDLDCLGCHHRRPVPALAAKCETGTYECMKGLTGEEVLAGVERALAGWSRPGEPPGGPAEIRLGSDRGGNGPDRIEPGLSPAGYPTLRVRDATGRWSHLHSGRDPVAEGLELAGRIPEDKDVVVLGMGLGYHLAALLENPRRQGRVAVVERDPDVFRAALKAGIITPHLNDSRLTPLVGLEPGEAAWRLKTLPLNRPEALVHRPSFRLSPAYYGSLAEHLKG